MFFVYNQGKLTSVTENFHDVPRGVSWKSRTDFKTFEDAESVADDATALMNELYLAVEYPRCSPRFDVIKAFKVGDKVSRAFNGDYYPDGEIVRISDSQRRIVTSTSSVYFRRRRTDNWVLTGGTWLLVSGHRDERNPSF